MQSMALDMSIDCWSLYQCVIIPWKSTAALATGESATDGALVLFALLVGHMW